MRHLRAFFLWLPLVLTLIAGNALAQDRNGLPDFEAWERTATRAEEAIEAGRASDAAFQELRLQLVDWRSQFVDAQSANAATIQTIEEQLAALGPKPEEGDEPPEIAESRAKLNQRLSELRTPGKTAELAYTRADGLIRGVDGILRERQSRQLLERGPSPLNPAYWPRALSSLRTAVHNIWGEASVAFNNPVQRERFTSFLPAVIVISLIAFVLLLRGHHWLARLTRRIHDKGRSSGRWLVEFIVSLGQPIVMNIALLMLIEAAYLTGLPGLRIDQILASLAPAGFLLFGAMWIGLRAFPRVERDIPVLDLPPEQRREGRVVAGLIGLVLGLSLILRVVAQFEAWADSTVAIVNFALVVPAALLVWRMSRLLREHGKRKTGEATEAPRYIDRLLILLGQALVLVAFAGPALSALGYLEASRVLTFSTMFSLLLFALLMILQRLMAELWVFVRGGDEDAREGLVPVLAGFLLAIVSAPFFALIWGARSTELDELWTRVKEGFVIGDTRISPSDFLVFAIVFVIGYTITRLLQGTLKNTVLPKTKMDVGGQNALVSGVGYVGIFLAAILAITSAGIDLSSLAIVAGALSVGIGFGLQNIVSNFVSGIILLIERPISEGDWIEVGGQMGYVRDISVRSTRIETFDRTDVIVPNADLVSGTVTNFTRGNTVGRVIVPVGVAYGTDTKWVEGILMEIAKAHPMVLMNPAPSVVFQGFGADSLDFEIRAILKDVNYVLSVKSDMNHEIAKRFVEEGIEIPFAQRDVWLRNPETLTGKSPAGDSAVAESEPADRGHLDLDDLGDGDTDADGGER